MEPTALPSNPGEAAEPLARPLGPPWLAPLACAALAGAHVALPSQRCFGDAPWMLLVLERSADRPTLHHPLPQAVLQLGARIVGPLEHADAHRFFGALGALSAALSLWLLARIAARAGARPLLAWAAAALVVASPAAVFHANVAEVHGLQLLGAAAAVALASGALPRLRGLHHSPSAPLRFALAAACAAAGHLANVVLWPALLWLCLTGARPAPSGGGHGGGRGGWRGWLAVAALGLLAGGLVLSGGAEAQRGSLDLLLWIGSLIEDWSPAFHLRYLARELLAHYPLALGGLLLGLLLQPRWRGPLALGIALPALALPLTQVDELGGYGAMLLPWCALGIGALLARVPAERAALERGLATLLCLAALGQFAVGVDRLRRFEAAAPDAIAWLERLRGALPESARDALVLTETSPRTYAIQGRAPELRAIAMGEDLADFGAGRVAGDVALQRAFELARDLGVALVIDRSLTEAPPVDDPTWITAPWREELAEVLERYRAALEPLGSPPLADLLRPPNAK